MLITYELSECNYQPWSGAVYAYNRIIDEGKWDEFESMLEELYPDGMTETQLNDLLWFDSDGLYETLGIEDEEEEEDEEE